jgi:hypothetical protein
VKDAEAYFKEIEMDETTVTSLTVAGEQALTARLPG